MTQLSDVRPSAIKGQYQPPRGKTNVIGGRLDDSEGDGYQRVGTIVRTPTGEMDASIYVHAQAQN